MLVSSPQAAEQAQPMQACMMQAVVSILLRVPLLSRRTAGAGICGEIWRRGLVPTMKVDSEVKLCRASG